MSYYRLNNHQTDLLVGPTVLLPDGTYLTEANRNEHSYPVQGWSWFDNDVAAYTALLPDMVPQLQAQLQAQQETIDALLAALGGDSE